jgi:hypothetical protein
MTSYNACAHHLRGELLRRERRRTEARAQLRSAHKLFDAMGMESVRRARRESRATGEIARKRTPDMTGDLLTVHQRATVQYYLGTVFVKQALPSAEAERLPLAVVVSMSRARTPFAMPLTKLRSTPTFGGRPPSVTRLGGWAHTKGAASELLCRWVRDTC